MEDNSTNFTNLTHYMVRQRSWYFRETFDGVFLLLAINSIGTLLNSFQIWILFTRAELATMVNTMIMIEAGFRLWFCSVAFLYKVWIVAWVPVQYPGSIQKTSYCSMGSKLGYIGTAGTIIFNMLTNIVRYMFIAKSRNLNATVSKFVNRLNFHIYAASAGFVILIVQVIHMSWLPVNQLYFDQACINPHGELQARIWPARLHNGVCGFENLISIAFCTRLYLWIRAEVGRRTIPLTERQMRIRQRRNLYTAGVGILHLLVMAIALAVIVTPFLYWTSSNSTLITTSTQCFMLEVLSSTVHGIVTPLVIFWASTEARKSSVLAWRDLRGRFRRFPH